MAEHPLRVMIVDDYEIVRRGIARLLETTGDMTVCGEAGAVAEAIEVVQESDPDLAIIDLRLPDGSGVQASRAIRARRPGTRVVLLTVVSEEEAAVAAVMAGASGYLLKQLRGNDIVEALRDVGHGRRLFDPSVAHAVVRDLVAAAGAVLDEEDRQLLALVTCGKTDREIEDLLALEKAEATSRLAALFSKLNFTGRPGTRAVPA